MKWLMLLLGCAWLLGAGCARDVNDPEEEEPYPIEVQLGFSLRGELSPDLWYYTVFNFTAAPSTVAATAPVDVISNEGRGKNWELYVAIHPQPGGGAELYCLQRPRVPTVLLSGDGPTDVSSGDFNKDTIRDLAVACYDGGLVQYIAGSDTEVFNTTYFEDAVTIDSGVRPFRLAAGVLDADVNEDLAVLYAGDESTPAELRVLKGDGAGLFTQLGTYPVTGTPTDAVFDKINGDNQLDCAILTVDTDGGPGTLRIFLGAADGSFSQAASYPLGSDPVALAIGQLDDSGLDIAVALPGSSTTDGSIQVFTGAGDGTFTAAETLAVAGQCLSVSIGIMFGSRSDVVYGLIGADGKGALGVYQNESDGRFTAPPDITALTIIPRFIVAHNASNDSEVDVLAVDGALDSSGNSLVIMRGDRIVDLSTFEARFAWSELEVNYLAGTGASRIHLADLDQDSDPDLIMPNSAPDSQDRHGISLFYRLGKYNYTSADIFWTDEPPQLLNLQEWYVSHSLTPNRFTLTLDPGLFFDLARLPPEEFLVTFMSSTTGIDLENNLLQLGEVRDHLSAPVNVPMEIGHYDDEQNTPRANENIAANPAEDINNWGLEVF